MLQTIAVRYKIAQARTAPTISALKLCCMWLYMARNKLILLTYIKRFFLQEKHDKEMIKIIEGVGANTA